MKRVVCARTDNEEAKTRVVLKRVIEEVFRLSFCDILVEMLSNVVSMLRYTIIIIMVPSGMMIKILDLSCWIGISAESPPLCALKRLLH